MPVGFTDRCLVACNVVITKLKPQSTYWHFDTTLLSDSNFIELKKPEEIRRCFSTFYADLYRSEYQEQQELFYSFCETLPRIPENIAVELEEPLTLHDLATALQGLKRGKAPGNDGIPVELYKEFWEELGTDLLIVYNESFKHLILPLSCRRARITLLPKKEDPQEVKNWCLPLFCAQITKFYPTD